MKGKTRCDNKRPSCTRCIAKGNECHYPATSRRAAELGVQKVDNVSNPRKNPPISPLELETHVTSESPLGVGSDVDAIIDGVLASSNLVPTDLDDGIINGEAQNIELDDLFDLQGSQRPSQFPPSSWRPFEGPQTDLFFNLSIPAQVTSNSRALILRPEARSGGQGIAKLIMYTLKSYVRMMLQHDTLPPFIHRWTISPDLEHVNTEPLTNCITLLHMIGSQTRGSRKLFWRNVKLECERLLEDVSRVSLESEVN